MRQRLLWIATIPALAAALSACKAERKPPAIGSDLAAPTGLYVVGTGANATLLVSNANFRLEYESGSLLAIDLGAVDESQRRNLVDDVSAAALELPNFSGPIALTPDGKTALITNRFTEGEARTANDRLLFVDVTNPMAPAIAQIHPGTSDTSNAITVGDDPYGVITVALPPSGPDLPPRDLAFVANETEGTISVVNLDPGTTCNDGRPAPCLQDALGLPRATGVVFADAGSASNLVFDGPGVSPDITRDQHWTVTFVEGNGVCPAPTDVAVPAGYWRVVGSAIGQLTRHACTGIFFADTQISFQISRVTDSAGNITGAPPTNGDHFDFDTYAGDFESPSGIRLTQFVGNGSISGIGVGQILYDPYRERLYATSRRTAFIYVIDALTYRSLGAWQITSAVGGVDSRGLALSPDGTELYVVNRSPEALLIINPDSFPTQLDAKVVTDGVVASIPVGSSPGEVVLSPDAHYAFVTGFASNTVDVIDLHTRLQLRSIPTSQAPYTIRLSSDGKRAYVATYFGPTIDVLDVDDTSPTFGTVLTSITNKDYTPEF